MIDSTRKKSLFGYIILELLRVDGIRLLNNHHDLNEGRLDGDFFVHRKVETGFDLFSVCFNYHFKFQARKETLFQPSHLWAWTTRASHVTTPYKIHYW